jgi:hypothetical protein
LVLDGCSFLDVNEDRARLGEKAIRLLFRREILSKQRNFINVAPREQGRRLLNQLSQDRQCDRMLNHMHGSTAGTNKPSPCCISGGEAVIVGPSNGE